MAFAIFTVVYPLPVNLKLFTEVELIYNVSFYFTANDSDIHACSFSYSFPYGLPQDVKYSFVLCSI